MIKLSNTRLAALITTAAIGVGAVAVPAASMAASHPSKVKKVTTHKTAGKGTTRNDSPSPDKSGSSPDPAGSER